MANVQHADAGGEVDVPVAIDVGEAGAASGSREDGHRRCHPTGHVAVSLSLEFPRSRPGPVGHHRMISTRPMALDDRSGSRHAWFAARPGDVRAPFAVVIID